MFLIWFRIIEFLLVVVLVVVTIVVVDVRCCINCDSVFAIRVPNRELLLFSLFTRVHFVRYSPHEGLIKSHEGI